MKDPTRFLPALLLGAALAACSPAPESPAPSGPPAGSKSLVAESTKDGEAALDETGGKSSAPDPARKHSEIDPRAVTFMAYNLRNYLVMERGKEELPKPAREITALVAMIADVKPDLLGVCEIGTENDLKDLQARLKAAGVDLPNLEYCDGPDAVRNLGLLGKFPVVATKHQTNLRYRLGNQELPFNRGILDATVEPAPGYRLQLLGTHLKSKREVEDADQSEMRRNEAALLRRHVEGILAQNPDANLLVYGDLNDTKQTDVIKSITGSNTRADALESLYLRDRHGHTWTHFWSTGDSYTRIDYAMCSKAFLPEVLRSDSYIHHAPEWFTASDHRPLVVRFIPEDKPPRKR